MALYLLDSDAVIDWTNDFEPSKKLIGSLVEQEHVLATCDVVLTEVYAGLREERERRSRDFIGALRYLETPRTAAVQAGRWRYASAREGRTLSAYDMLVAAVAKAHNATLVTGNVRDFRIPEISILQIRR